MMGVRMEEGEVVGKGEGVVGIPEGDECGKRREIWW